MQQRTTYTHAQWKAKYDALSQSITETQQQSIAPPIDTSRNMSQNSSSNRLQKNAVDSVNTLLDLIKQRKKLEIIGTHYDFYSQPHVLLARLIRDARQLLSLYDLTYPANQSDCLRYAMQEIHNAMNKAESATEYLVDAQKNIADFQTQYAIICQQLTVSANELRQTENNFFAKLKLLLNKYSVDIPEIHFTEKHALSAQESQSLEREEKRLYTEAVNNLTKKLTELPNEMSAVKLSGLELINRCESKRVECEKNTCAFNKTPFDYKRHTINLTKTHQLLKSRDNKTAQDEYKLLIKSNPSNHVDRFKACLKMIFGAICVAIGIIVMPVNLPIGLSMTIGGGLGAFAGAGFFANTFRPNTEKHMSDIYKHAIPRNRA